MQTADKLIEMRRLAKHSGKPSVLIQQYYPRAQSTGVRIPPCVVTNDCVLGFIEVSKTADLQELLPLLTANVDILFKDVDNDQSVAQQLKWPGIEVFPYSERGLWISAIAQTLVQLQAKRGVLQSKVFLAGQGRLMAGLLIELLRLGFLCHVSANDLSAEKLAQEFGLTYTDQRGPFDFIVGTSQQTAVVDRKMIDQLAPQGAILDGGIGTISAEIVADALKRGIDIFRLDIRASAEGFVRSTLYARNIVNQHMGRDTVAGIGVIACGIMGRNGDVVLDSISEPQIVLGVADGAGRMKSSYSETERLSVKRINELIQRQI